MEAEIEKSSIRVENGEVVVDVELKEKFEPKDGDFLYTNGGVFICNIVEKYKYLYAYIGTEYGVITTDTEGVIWSLRSSSRYATPEEKSAFIARLEKEYGKRWNEEKKCLEDIRWRAKLCETYWYITDTCVSNEEELASSDDDLRYKNNNYFRTKEAAQKVADQIKEIFKNSKAE